MLNTFFYAFLGILKINNSLLTIRLIFININFFSSYVTKWTVEKSGTENTVKSIFWSSSNSNNKHAFYDIQSNQLFLIFNT